MSPADPTRPARIGYVLKVYPRFSETFVVTEILARERAGEDLTIFALRPTTDARFHPELADVQAPVRHLAKPVKLSEAWSTIGRAEQELPDFAARYASLLSVLTRMDAADAIQGVELAMQAHAAGITHLHAHFASLAARVARVAATVAGITYSVTTHAKDLFHDDVDAFLLQDVLEHADHVVAISEYNRQYLIGRFPQLTGNTVLVRNGLNLDTFGYTDPGEPHDPLRVLAVGRLVEKKGFADLIDAAAIATGTGVRLQVRIAGDGDLRGALQQRIDKAGLGASVELLGPRSQREIRELLSWADAFAAPCVVGSDGNADGLPTVLLEAMATGVPCVATAVTGIPEAITHDTGVLLPPGDVPALTEALQQMTTPRFPRRRLARAARALVEANYDTERQSALLAGHQNRTKLTQEVA